MTFNSNAQPLADFTEEWLQALRVNTMAIPFYRDLYSNAPSDLDSLFQLPSFEKSQLAEYGKFPLSVNGALRAYRVCATSGTTGERLYVAFDKCEWDRTAEWLGSVGLTVGFGKDDILVNTHCYGLWVGGAALDLLATQINGGLIPVGPADPELVLSILGSRNGTAISATPSYLKRMVETAKSSGFDLTKTSVKLGFIGAEMADEGLRSKLQESLPAGFKWIELYGLTETGGPSVAFAPDPSKAELILNLDDYIFEILDVEKDQHVKDGEVGELTITTRRTDSLTPLIRYRTRDLVKAVAGSPDRPTAISRILGRVDESLKVGGVLVYPSSVASIVSQHLEETREWRADIIQSGPDNELIITAETTEDECRIIERAFSKRLGLTLRVQAVDFLSLERSFHKTKHTRILAHSFTEQ